MDGHELREGFPARALFIWWQRSEQLGVCAPYAVECLVRDRHSVVKLPKQRHPSLQRAIIVMKCVVDKSLGETSRRPSSAVYFCTVPVHSGQLAAPPGAGHLKANKEI